MQSRLSLKVKRYEAVDRGFVAFSIIKCEFAISAFDYGIIRFTQDTGGRLKTSLVRIFDISSCRSSPSGTGISRDLDSGISRKRKGKTNLAAPYQHHCALAPGWLSRLPYSRSTVRHRLLPNDSVANRTTRPGSYFCPLPRCLCPFKKWQVTLILL